MPASEFTVGDKESGVALKFNSESGELTATYAPENEPSPFQAILRASDNSLRQRLEELCEGAASSPYQRDAIVNTRLSQLTPRAGLGLKTAGRVVRGVLEWLLYSNENTNWTYDLSPRNLLHLANMVALVTNRPVDEIKKYVGEPDADAELREHIASTLTNGPAERSGLSDPVPRWGRRIGWYAVVRALKPKLVVETGVDKGLGAVLLCSALARNANEGQEGRYIGTDINPAAGYLLGGSYGKFGEIRYGDSIDTLKTITDPVDVLINDSDHSADYEYREYQTLASIFHPKSVILGDNAHSTDMLMQFASETGRQFLFFRELPQGHWYPGAGIGFAFTQ